MEETKQTKRGGKGKANVNTKTPVIVKYVIENIDKGIYPSIDTLDDIFDEVDNRYYREIAISLLNRVDLKPSVERKASNPTSHTQETQSVEREAPRQPKVKPQISQTKVLTPATLESAKGKGSVISRR